MAEVIEVDIKNFSYGKEQILKNVTFSVKKGEVAVLTGFSGSGKSTLIRLINGLIPELYEGELQGEIKILGKSVNEYKTGELAKHIGNVFQNPDEQFFAGEVENEIALVGENTGMPRSLLQKKVEEAMKKLGISELSKKKLHQLSGGQKQKVAIASTLVYDSEVIIFDEPTANLDYSSIEELRNILKRLKAEGKTIIIAEHRISYLKDILDRLILLKDGKLEKIFNAGDINENMQKEYMLRCLDYSKLRGVAPQHSEVESAYVKNLLIKNKKYELAANADFSLNKGECMAVIGENGIGKTTMVKELIGLLPAYSGDISYGKAQKERMKVTAASLQNCRNMFFYETVGKELLPKKEENNEAYKNLVKEYLEHLDLWEKRMLNPHELSGGEKQRLALLIALLKKSEIIVLDEPTSGLDYKRMALVSSAIEKRAKDVPIILITHDIELLFKTCNTAFLMSKNGHKKIPVRGNEDLIREFMHCNM